MRLDYTGLKPVADAPVDGGYIMKRFTLCVLALLPLAAAAESTTTQPEVFVAPASSAQHAVKQPWLDRAMLRARDNAIALGLDQRYRPEVMAHTTVLKWPVRKAITVTVNEVQYLSQYLDQDDSGAILDVYCGTRTYDGHNGTDIGVGPYSWYSMRNNQGIAIAAAPGTIVDKVDNLPEDSCDTNQKDGNVVTVQHADGSYASYAHIRTGSALAKGVGDYVYTGEYIGVIGSSGISSGPHLHFHVGFFEGNQFVYQDPWGNEGACNNIGGTKWWEDAPPALIPFIMSITTHSAPPVSPACPQTETPNFANTFNSGDAISFRATVHDWPEGQSIGMLVRRPDNSVAFNLSSGVAPEDRLRAWSTGFDTNLPGNAMAGEWKFEVTFDGETDSHSFWVNTSPPVPAAPTVANNAYAGLWYDQSLSGEGYNVITSPAGTVIFFYGSDEDGNRLWLISETLPGNFVLDDEVQILMYESTGGAWPSPIASGRGLSEWGNLWLTFTSCTTGSAVLQGEDGMKNSNLVKLAGIAGSGCGHAGRGDVARSGLWYDTGLSGEGFNFIVAPNGVVIFYYGFDADGNRLWMHSDLLPETFDVGGQYDSNMYRAMQGDFVNPVANALQDWGDITVDVNACNSLSIEMTTNEGDKVSDTVQLANVIGLGCP